MKLKEWKIAIDMGDIHNPIIAIVTTSVTASKGVAIAKAAFKKFGKANKDKAMTFNKFDVLETKLVDK